LSNYVDMVALNLL